MLVFSSLTTIRSCLYIRLRAERKQNHVPDPESLVVPKEISYSTDQHSLKESERRLRAEKEPKMAQYIV